jgi:hypothetical protein
VADLTPGFDPYATSIMMIRCPKPVIHQVPLSTQNGTSNFLMAEVQRLI